jgi:hypothetical protein
MLSVFTTFIIAFIIFLDAFKFLRISFAAQRNAGRTLIVGSINPPCPLHQKGLSFISNRQRRNEGTFCASELAEIEPTPTAPKGRHLSLVLFVGGLGICVSGITTLMFSKAKNIVLQLLQLEQKIKRACRGTG